MVDQSRDLPQLRIPERYHTGFVMLAGLKDEVFQGLLSVLSREHPAVNYLELSSRISEKIEAIPPDNIVGIIETLDALYGIRARLALPIPEFVEVVLRAMDESGVEELGLSGEDREHLKDRLVRLLDLDSLDATSKATDVLLEHEHTIHDARVMTDIRPVFGLNTDAPPIGAMVVHALKLSYHEADELKELFVALDTGDVDRLIETLERAKSKAKSLERVIEAAKVPYIDMG